MSGMQGMMGMNGNGMHGNGMNENMNGMNGMGGMNGMVNPNMMNPGMRGMVHGMNPGMNNMQGMNPGMNNMQGMNPGMNNFGNGQVHKQVCRNQQYILFFVQGDLNHLLATKITYELLIYIKILPWIFIYENFIT